MPCCHHRVPKARTTSPGPGKLAQGEADQMVSAPATQKAVTMSRNGLASTWLGINARRNSARREVDGAAVGGVGIS